MISSSCWIWLGVVSRHGYGRAYNPEKMISEVVHRQVWEQMNGPLGSGLELHHLCGEKRCYRPDHLIAVGRLAHRYLEGLSRATCPLGHLYDGVNTYFRPDRPWSRMCRACRAAAGRRSKARMEQFYQETLLVTV